MRRFKDGKCMGCGISKGKRGVHLQSCRWFKMPLELTWDVKPIEVANEPADTFWTRFWRAIWR